MYIQIVTGQEISILGIYSAVGIVLYAMGAIILCGSDGFMRLKTPRVATLSSSKAEYFAKRNYLGFRRYNQLCVQIFSFNW